jgi:hypothetical protein
MIGIIFGGLGASDLVEFGISTNLFGAAVSVGSCTHMRDPMTGQSTQDMWR